MGRRRRYWWVDLGWYGTLRDDLVTLWHIGWNGIPDQCTAFRALGRTGEELLREVEGAIQMLLDRNNMRKVTGGEVSGVVDLEFSNSHPVLFSYLTQRKWPDGTPRQTSSLTIFEDGGIMKAVLKDRDAGLSLWASSPTIARLYDVLEALLCDSQAEWRTERSPTGGQARRVKK